MTEQEDELYQAMTEGDWDAVQQMRDDAYASGSLEIIDEYENDYFNAHAHYQADNEMSEEEREQATAEHVEVENIAAQEEGAEAEE